MIAALEFFENRKIWRKWVENPSVGGPWWDGGWWTENRFFAISRDWSYETLRNFQEWREMVFGGFRESLVTGGAPLPEFRPCRAEFLENRKIWRKSVENPSVGGPW